MWSWSRFVVGIVAILFAIAASTCPAVALLMVTDGNGTLTTAESLRKVLAVVEVGAMLANTNVGNSTASGRRVRLPWGGGAFDITTLNANAQTMALRAIDWAITDDRVLHLKLNEASGTTAADSSIYARPGTARATTGVGTSKSAACQAIKGDVELQCKLWRHNTESWPAMDLSNIGADSHYFGAGAPACPVDGGAYSIDSSGRVVGHNH